MKYTLLLDTSDKYLTVGVALDDEVIYSTSFEAWQRQSEFLVVEIKKAIEQVNISLKDIDTIVTGIGPGSYTGVRIALTFAKVLASTTNVKIKTVSSIALLGDTSISFVGLINARSKRSYIGIYDKGNVVLKDTIKTNEEVLSLIEKYKELGYEIKGDLSYLNIDTTPSDIVKGLLSFSKISEEVKDVLSLKPIYLKEALW